MNRRSFMRGVMLVPLAVVPGIALAQQKYANGGVVKPNRVWTLGGDHGPELFGQNCSQQVLPNPDFHRLMKDVRHKFVDIMIKQKEAQAISENTPFLSPR